MFLSCFPRRRGSGPRKCPCGPWPKRWPCWTLSDPRRICGLKCKKDKSTLCLEQHCGVVTIHIMNPHRPPSPDDLSEMEQWTYTSIAQSLLSLQSTRAYEPPEQRAGQHTMPDVANAGPIPDLPDTASCQDELSSFKESFTLSEQRVGQHIMLVTAQIEPTYPAQEGPIPDLPDIVSCQQELSSPEESFSVDDFDTAMTPGVEQSQEVVLWENEVKMLALEPQDYEVAVPGTSVLPVNTNDFQGDRITTPAPGLAPDTDVFPASLPMPHLPILASGKGYWYFLIFTLLFFSALCSLYFNKI